ncbi:hypothetical protein FOZ62_005815 [Perkinsus olseni]|uniref:Uncharacterized protein n=1 Tax=Perkinsus olseni TaxID=32597 RepID=A0A7J6QSU6_PEROL|nr:hypothetical protein FOZ62_005815 [Perkinsus olseni]
MRLPAEIMALELRVLETMLEKSGRSGTLPEVGKAYMDFLGTRPCTLDCPREEILVNPPPSYIFVMNEDLCGVYPTPTGVYIRKPLERGVEVMVLQPGFQGTKAVYYYNNNQSRLFVLCEDNRKLIQYNLSDSPVGQGVTTEVLGLPKATALNKTASQLLYTDDFVFIIFPTGHLFCIDRLDIRDAAQAKLISADRLDAGSTRSLLSVPGDPKAVKLAVLGYRRFKMITLKLKQRRSPLYFEQDTEELDVASKLGETNSEMMLVQDIDGQCLAVMARSGGVSGCRIFLCSRSLRPLGKALVFSNEYQPVRNLQVVFGADDLVYILREDNTLVERFLEEDYDPESVHESELRGEYTDYSRACRLATYYIYR